jgi:hypothetical protein
MERARDLYGLERAGHALDGEGVEVVGHHEQRLARVGASAEALRVPADGRVQVQHLRRHLHHAEPAPRRTHFFSFIHLPATQYCIEASETKCLLALNHSMP